MCCQANPDSPTSQNLDLSPVCNQGWKYVLTRKWNKAVVTRHSASGAWQVTVDHSDDMYMCVHIQRNVLK